MSVSTDSTTDARAATRWSTFKASIHARLQRALGHRWSALGVIVLALVLASPSIGTGLSADDFFHKLVLRHDTSIPALPTGSNDIFVFSRDANSTRALIEEGIVSWWSDPEARVGFLRPVSAITHVIDHALWPESAALMHVHSLLWFSLALTLLGVMYRRWIAGTDATSGNARWIGTLCLLLYAIDDAHGFSLAWIANRNAWVALLGTLSVLWLHDRARRDGVKVAAWIAPFVYAIALLAGESAIACMAYLVAYALTLDRAGVRRGLLSLAPFFAITVAWRVIYNALGYGALHSGLVIDPGREPLLFLQRAVVRLPVLLVGQLGFPMADLWEAYGLAGEWAPVVAMTWIVTILSAITLLVWPLLKREAVARFFALGMLLAAVPLCAQYSHDRLLVQVGIGGMGLIGLWLSRWLERDATLSETLLPAWIAAGVSAYLVVFHVVLAPPLFAFRSLGPAEINRMVQPGLDVVDATADVTRKTLVFINPPSEAFVGYIPMTRAAERLPRPHRLRWLATGASELVVERLDERRLRVTPKDAYLSLISERMLRSTRRPFVAGQVIKLSDMQVTVDAVNAEGTPTVATFELNVPLESPNLVFLTWGSEGIRPYKLPAIGARDHLPKFNYFAL